MPRRSYRLPWWQRIAYTGCALANVLSLAGARWWVGLLGLALLGAIVALSRHSRRRHIDRMRELDRQIAYFDGEIERSQQLIRVLDRRPQG